MCFSVDAWKETAHTSCLVTCSGLEKDVNLADKHLRADADLDDVADRTDWVGCCWS